MTVKILVGDCRDQLKTLESESVNCVVTSPPYFGLRDYGMENQIGHEDKPEEFVAALVEVFREVWRVLREDGTVWLNLGDSYVSVGSGTQGADGEMATRRVAQVRDRKAIHGTINRPPSVHGLKPKNLIGIPWKVAFALQAEGWFLRQDIIWHKPNPMPESVRDRCTKAHEYIFLLSKSERYYFDADAISEQVADSSIARWAQDAIDDQSGSDRVPGKKNGSMKTVGRTQRPQAKRAVELAREAGLTEAHIAAIRAVGITDAGKAQVTQAGTGKSDPHVQALANEAKAALGGYYREFLIADKRNKRSVWTVPTMPFKEAHFATFPPALVEPCILAGCPKGGVVLDPFGGAGTAALVADRLHRNALIIELNPEYAEMARARITGDSPLFSEVAA